MSAVTEHLNLHGTHLLSPGNNPDIFSNDCGKITILETEHTDNINSYEIFHFSLSSISNIKTKK
jgi:hypothetical protein